MPTPLVMLVRNLGIYMNLDAAAPRSMVPSFYRLVRQPLLFLALRKANRLCFVSTTFRDQVTNQMRVSINKTRIVHHGVSSMFAQHLALPSRPRYDEPYLLAVSSLNPHKNYETLIRAYAQLADDAPALLIAGEPLHQPTVERLHALIQQYRLEQRVRLLGKVGYADLPALYRGAIAFTFPSQRETFGHPLVEAMASGTPIIASDLPVCHEICQNAAIYVDSRDAHALAAQIQIVLHNPVLREELVQRGLERAQSFSWNESARRLIRVFEELA
jgi:glycosyltransferase involved in cell wall biosynthesis